MNAARKSQRPERPRPDEATDAARPVEETEGARPHRDASEAPPHAMWDQLDEWVGDGARGERPARKFPVPARLAIIFVLSIACWAVLIALIMLA